MGAHPNLYIKYRRYFLIIFFLFEKNLISTQTLVISTQHPAKSHKNINRFWVLVRGNRVCIYKLFSIHIKRKKTIQQKD